MARDPSPVGSAFVGSNFLRGCASLRIWSFGFRLKVRLRGAPSSKGLRFQGLVLRTWKQGLLFSVSDYLEGEDSGPFWIGSRFESAQLCAYLPYAMALPLEAADPAMKSSPIG